MVKSIFSPADLGRIFKATLNPDQRPRVEWPKFTITTANSSHVIDRVEDITIAAARDSREGAA
ncbi:MAG: hypothetical protein Q8R02_19355 [Hyphomonadaceae bacterium]|nr:hypothetical protein [Hyphomonadaceae bacterium]